MNDQVLTGWVCVIWHQQAFDTPLHVPYVIRDALISRGWFQYEIGWDGVQVGGVTEAGETVAELNGAEWGIDTLSNVLP